MDHSSLYAAKPSPTTRALALLPTSSPLRAAAALSHRRPHWGHWCSPYAANAVAVGFRNWTMILYKDKGNMVKCSPKTPKIVSF
jgi:hypothetical protein